MKSEQQSHVTSNTLKVNEIDETITRTKNGIFQRQDEPTERSGLMEYTYKVGPSHGSTEVADLL